MSKTENSLIKRWVTGLIIAPVLVIVILYCHEIIFAGLVILFTLGGMWEYNKMVFGDGFVWEKTESMIFAAALPLIVLCRNNQYITALLAFSVLIVFISFIASIKKSDYNAISVAKAIFGIMYIPFLMSYFVALRIMDKGSVWIIFVLILAFIGDIAALYVGKYFGKHKLAPLVSPNKTVEGLVGLVAGSTVACLIFAYCFLPEVPLVHVAAIAFAGSIIGQLGDICESAIKRTYHLKDAGSILPGHGGILDRLDCLLFIVPFVYYYRVFVIS